MEWVAGLLLLLLVSFSEPAAHRNSKSREKTKINNKVTTLSPCYASVTEILSSSLMVSSTGT